MRYRSDPVSRHIDQIKMFYFAELFAVFYAIPALFVSVLGCIPRGAVWLSDHGRGFLLLYLTCALTLAISITLYSVILTWKVSSPARRSSHLLPAGGLHGRSRLVLLNLSR
jgi:hypothetical protein